MYKYQLLSSILEKAIKEGQYIQGGKLPSIRQLSYDFSAHKSTVIKALDILVHKNLIYAVPQSGYYVITRSTEPSQSAIDFYDFKTSSPDPKLFPYEDFRHCINQAIHKYKSELFIYGTSQGLPGLISISKKILMRYQIFTSKNNIVITSGVQQSLSLLIHMPLANNGDTVLIEQPSYHLLIDQLQTLKIKIAFIQRDENGIDLLELESIFSQGHIKFFYIMPRFHNPLGSSLKEYQKKAIIKLAYKYNVYIVEDDFLADYETDRKSDPLFTYDYNRKYVIYLKSFSKIIFPGLRVGFAVVPDSLVDSFIKRKTYADIDSAMISQAALEIYFRSGMFEQHANKMNALYLSRANELHDTLKLLCQNFDKIVYHEPKSRSVFTCLGLQHPAPISTLRENGIQLMSITENYAIAYKNKKHYLRLNVSNMEEKLIKDGLTKLFKFL